jgi:hypothetical protein
MAFLKSEGEGGKNTGRRTILNYDIFSYCGSACQAARFDIQGRSSPKLPLHHFSPPFYNIVSVAEMPEIVGWVERSEPHQLNYASFLVGLAALDPHYRLFRNKTI